MDEGEDPRRLISTACRVLKANGHDDFIWGHVSLRDPAGRGYWMKASGHGFEEVGLEEVLLIDDDGRVLEGNRSRHSEWPIHTEIMLEHRQLNAVVHTHPPYSIALMASGMLLAPISHAGTLFTPPDIPKFDLTANLITTRDLGRSLAAALVETRVVFMVNHGIVTAGETVMEAVVRAVLLEQACRQQVLAASVSSELTAPSAEESLLKRSTVWPQSRLDELWDYLVRTSQ